MKGKLKGKGTDEILFMSLDMMIRFLFIYLFICLFICLFVCIFTGFTCPGKETIGPQGLLQAHPVFPHPTDCQFFFTCFFGKDPNKFGCSKGQVFDSLSLTCKDPLDVPECSCWYDCGENSNCPGTCQADCSCPVE